MGLNILVPRRYVVHRSDDRSIRGWINKLEATKTQWMDMLPRTIQSITITSDYRLTFITNLPLQHNTIIHFLTTLYEQQTSLKIITRQGYITKILLSHSDEQ